MKTDRVKYYPSIINELSKNQIENAWSDFTLFYSFRHLTHIEDISQENIMEAVQKSLQICHLAGINSKHHFKQIFVFDLATKTLFVDWRMSKTGFNLLMIQMPVKNYKLAYWLWKLSEHKAP